MEKARRAVEWTDGVVAEVTDEEILDAKRRIDGAGIGCEPASAASLAGIKKLVDAGTIPADADVVAILTGHLLKDPDYVYRYHTEKLTTPSGDKIEATFGTQPIVMPNDPARIAGKYEALFEEVLR